MFYVTLGKDGDAWKPVAMSDRPQPPTADRITLKARARFGYWPSLAGRIADGAGSVVGKHGDDDGPGRPPQPEPVMQVRYGIESYFVAEGKGRPLEETARERKLAAVIAVDGKGNAAIKRLMIDGKQQYEEPLL